MAMKSRWVLRKNRIKSRRRLRHEALEARYVLDGGAMLVSLQVAPVV